MGGYWVPDRPFTSNHCLTGLMKMVPLLYIWQFALCAVFVSGTTDQKLLGLTYPKPTNVSASPDIQHAVSQIMHTLQVAMDTGVSTFSNFTGKKNSLSITVSTAQEPIPLLDFHYTPDNLNISAGSVSKITGDTIYRIGSVSKLFTVYALLLEGGAKYWNTAITEYIPELRSKPFADDFSEINSVQWENVTIGALAAQLSGIGRDGKLVVWTRNTIANMLAQSITEI